MTGTVGRPRVKNPLTQSQRNTRHKAKMDKFGVKRMYYRASETQRELIAQLRVAEGITSNEELVAYAIQQLGLKHGITLKSIKEDLECLKQSQSCN